MNYLGINTNGNILAIQSGNVSNTDPFTGNSGITTVTCTDADIALARSSPNAYWNGTQVVAPPASPGNSYAWDAVNKVWTLNIALGQSLAWTRIKAARDAAIASGVTYNGNVYDSNATSQLRLMGAAQMAQIAISSGTAYSVNWTLQNNSLVTLTAQEVIALAMAVGQNYQTLFNKGQSLRSQIMAATTQSQLDAVVW